MYPDGYQKYSVVYNRVSSIVGNYSKKNLNTKPVQVPQEHWHTIWLSTFFPQWYAVLLKSSRRNHNLQCAASDSNVHETQIWRFHQNTWNGQL